MKRYLTPAAIALFALSVVGLQVWISVQNSRRAEQIVEQLSRLEPASLGDEKVRQEVLSLRIQNELNGFFLSGLFNALGPMIAGLGALIGVWLGFRNYLQVRDKDRLDRAAGDLKAALDNLVSDENRKRAVGVVGLLHFLTPDKADYHLRVLSALVTAARVETNPEVIRGIRIAVEQAVAMLPERVLQQVSWQGVKLNGVSLAGRSLQMLDLRDASLEDADLRGVDLTAAQITNARLNGARLARANLTAANLTYVDLAGATLAGARLDGATLHHAKVSGMDVSGAHLDHAVFDVDEFNWGLVKNWRRAHLSKPVLDRLLELYGPEPSGPQVLMLMWEIPPLVAGGTWTASYHLVRQLRRRGARVTVVVPWDESLILSTPFGREVEVVALGMKPPAQFETAYGGAATVGPWSSYAPSGWSVDRPSPYGGSGVWSPYGTPASWSPYGPAGGSPWNSYAATSAGGSGYSSVAAGSAMVWLVEEFKQRLKHLTESRAFDLIHAHDWVTFPAAHAAAAAAGKHWVAHFHSTEADRRPVAPDPIVVRYEQEGVQAARRVVVPSQVTRRAVQAQYGLAEASIAVIPNPLSLEAASPATRGSFESRRVVFVGRLTAQKGPDRFEQVAQSVRSRLPSATFLMYGAGEEYGRLASSAIARRGPLAWSDRALAYQNASAVLMTSRSEPFGMVILEAMQHGVPVLFPEQAGASDVLTSGIRIQPDDIEGTSAQLERLLREWAEWDRVVRLQSDEVAQYAARGYENTLIALWRDLTPTPQQ